MLNETPLRDIHLACGETDMRKSIHGLAALVQVAFDLDPFSEAWFVFCNKERNKLKILRWDHACSQYPGGYTREYNNVGQPIIPGTKKTGTNNETHRKL